MFFSHLYILATNTRALTGAYLTNFKTITIFFQAMGFLTLATFA
jgi:hypothetical protein